MLVYQSVNGMKFCLEVSAWRTSVSFRCDFWEPQIWFWRCWKIRSIARNTTKNITYPLVNIQKAIENGHL